MKLIEETVKFSLSITVSQEIKFGYFAEFFIDFVKSIQLNSDALAEFSRNLAELSWPNLADILETIPKYDL